MKSSFFEFLSPSNSYPHSLVPTTPILLVYYIIIYNNNNNRDKKYVVTPLTVKSIIIDVPNVSDCVTKAWVRLDSQQLRRKLEAALNGVRSKYRVKEYVLLYFRNRPCAAIITFWWLLINWILRTPLEATIQEVCLLEEIAWREGPACLHIIEGLRSRVG